MENGESVLDAIFEEDNLEDVEMMDVEEGELVGQDSPTELGKNIGGKDDAAKPESVSKNRRRRNKKKNKKKKTDSGEPKVMDINRFVLDACRRLREKKTYLVYTAVGCLGISALSDLIKEVNAIQACGGQKTSNGSRCRTGGGILWSILKTREPNAYKEIMKKGKEFEKQFRQQSIIKKDQAPVKPERAAAAETCREEVTQSVDAPPVENKPTGQVDFGDKQRRSVHDRLRMPVHYDDLFEEEEQAATTDGTALLCD